MNELARTAAELDSGRARRRRRGQVLALGVVAILAYGLFQYGPRERPAAPSARFAALLEGAGDWEQVVWIAYPHQNLGVVDEALGDLDAYLAELARAAEARAPRLPRFGPFRIPPSRELALAWSGDGRAVLGMANVDPILGLLSRLAGRLAGNPWLAGGEATSGGRSFRIRWEGRRWIVESGGEMAGSSNRGASAGDSKESPLPALAEARLGRMVGPVPRGRYRLAREADGLEIRGGELPASALDPLEEARITGALRLDLPELALWTAIADRGPVGGPGLFLLWDDPEGLVPRVAVLQRGGGQRFRLPGQELLELAGKAEPRARLGWTALGTDRRARGEAIRIVPWLERNYPRPGAETPWLAAAGRLAPRRSLAMLERLGTRLRAIPLVGRAEIDRVEAGAKLLKPLVECPRVTFEVWREPDGVRVRLCPRASIDETTEAELESSPDEDGEIDENH